MYFSIIRTIVICLGCFASCLWAQKQSQLHEIYLKNGWKLHGDTVHLEQDIQINMPDGQVFRFPFSEVDSVKVLQSVRIKPTIYLKEKGYYMLNQLGFLLQQVEANPFTDINSQGNFYTLSFQSIHGYQFNPAFSAGVGTGMYFFSRGPILPIFGEIRGDVLDKGPVSPHYYLQMGYTFPLYSRDNLPSNWGNNWQLRDFNAKGGVMYDAGLGLKIRTSGYHSWLFTLGYQQQKLEESYWSWGSFFENSYTIRRYALNLGILF